MPLLRIHSITELRSALPRSDGQSIGLVPTMGFLHRGHASLLDRAREENDTVVLSVFVNPLQFTEDEDYVEYPRNDEQDDEIARKHGVDFIFAPSAEEMYPSGAPETNISVPHIGGLLEGSFRPGHFDGVCLVVTKLLNIIQPDRCYFGEKDFQQLAVVRRLTTDLSIPADIVGCPIVREADGLALSSRNVRLSTEERQAATLLNTALQSGAESFRQGAHQADQVEQAMKAVLNSEPGIVVDYAVAVSSDTLEPASHLSVPFQLLIAAKIGKTRLIDNHRVE